MGSSLLDSKTVLRLSVQLSKALKCTYLIIRVGSGGGFCEAVVRAGVAMKVAKLDNPPNTNRKNQSKNKK